MTLVINALVADNPALVQADGLIVPFVPSLYPEYRSNDTGITQAVHAVSGSMFSTRYPTKLKADGEVSFLNPVGVVPPHGSVITLVDHLDRPLRDVIFDCLLEICKQRPNMRNITVPFMRTGPHRINSEAADSQVGDMVRAAQMLLLEVDPHFRSIKALNLVLPPARPIMYKILRSKLEVLEEFLLDERFSKRTDHNPHGDFDINII